ncbi:uncharacterized protein METZ01_LOCUS45397 [marine metagenome]|uniref:Uncharacterized protein n=1 Tax=marine metagenome TaxID=408172 RepID=A0A381RUE6_9ZZZZ
MDVTPIVARSIAQFEPISISFPITTFPVCGIFSWMLFSVTYPKPSHPMAVPL